MCYSNKSCKFAWILHQNGGVYFGSCKDHFRGKSAGLGAIAGAADTYWGKNKGRSMEGMLVKMTKALIVLFILISVVLNLGVFN